MLDVFSRRIAGWSIADHLRSELVVDALEMARWPTKAAARPDRGPFGSWLAIHGVAFGQPLRASGLLWLDGRLVSALDSAMMESFFGTLQLELLDRRSWTTQAELARAIRVDRVRYSPRRRLTSIRNLSPLGYDRGREPAAPAA